MKAGTGKGFGSWRVAVAVSAVVALSTLVGRAGEAAPSAAGRPNILWITCEDIGPYLGCYGDPVAQTPRLDALAAQGIRYDRVYSVSGVCAPSRAAIITGMYPTSVGTLHMRTGGNAEFLPVRPYAAVLPPEVRCFPESLRAAGYYCTNNSKEDYQFDAPPTVWDESSRRAHWRDRPPGKPFFAVFNLTVTHESQIWARAAQPLTCDPATVPLPPYFPDTPVVRRDVARMYSNVAEMDRQAGRILDELRADGLEGETIVFFFSDHGGPLPRQKRAVYDSGLRVPFLVRFPDGEGAGTVNRELVSFVDLAPTVLSLTGLPVPGHLQGRAFLGAARPVEPRRYVFAGRDRLDTEYDRVRAVGDGRFKYLRNHLPGQPYYLDVAYRLQMPMMRELLRLRDGGLLDGVPAQWFRSGKPEEELFDTESDPHETRNLAGDPAYAGKLAEMRSAYAGWVTAVGDLGALNEAELVERMWQGGDRRPATAPVEFVYDAASRTVRVVCPTEGASIGFRRGAAGADPEGSWEVYTGPVPLESGALLEAMSMRIGYAASAPARFTAP